MGLGRVLPVLHVQGPHEHGQARPGPVREAHANPYYYVPRGTVRPRVVATGLPGSPRRFPSRPEMKRRTAPGPSSVALLLILTILPARPEVSATRCRDPARAPRRSGHTSW